jgi:hypothetical protein
VVRSRRERDYFALPGGLLTTFIGISSIIENGNDIGNFTANLATELGEKEGVLLLGVKILHVFISFIRVSSSQRSCSIILLLLPIFPTRDFQFQLRIALHYALRPNAGVPREINIVLQLIPSSSRNA